MTDEAKELVERLRGDWPEILVEKHWMMDSDAIDKQREEAADLIETQAREIERLREELMQIEVDAMEYYNDWMEHGCEQVEATRFAFDLGQYARAALAGGSHDQ